jgi:large subunit ribosomal protein L24
MNNKTVKPSKNRKRIYFAKLHESKKMLVAPIEKAVAKTVGKKKITVRKGDTVKIMRGQHKLKSGTVSKVDYDKTKVYLKEFNVTNSRGQEKPIPFIASNLMLTNVLLDDKKRIAQKKEIKKK